MSALTAAVPRRRRDASRRAAVGYLFVAPFLVIFVAMLVVPLVYAGYLSLFREQLIGGTSFAGLDNYTRAFGDERLWQGVARVGVFFLIQVPIMLVLALAFALALDSGVLWLSRLFRLGFFVPYAVPGVVATLMWGYLYGPEFGPVAQLFENHWLLLAGWVHYLAFDLFIGAWETRDAMARRIPRLLLAPCLVLTFMLGPIGLLCYHAVRARSNEPLDVAVLAPVPKAH